MDVSKIVMPSGATLNIKDASTRQAVDDINEVVDKIKGAIGYHDYSAHIDEFVDLDLPSGTLWAKCNIGAENPEDTGLYFAWGETVGYADATSGKTFDWSSYKYGTLNNLTKYNSTDGKMKLDLEDDAAYVNTEGVQKMPTLAQIQELLDNTNHTWTTVNGVNGRRFSSKQDSSKYIFIPASGYCDGSSVDDVGSLGHLWSSSRYSGPADAYYLDFGSGGASVDGDGRYVGCTVRGVFVENTITGTTKIENTIDKTYSQMVGLRDNNALAPGQWYRITDFVTTTSQADTQSGNHPFDIIVRADASNALNENAYASLHTADTYFANCKINAWELKYCLDNDTTRFAWADTTNGKGVIWYMKDEFNNQCPYDFKNIMFARYKITAFPKCPNLVNTYCGLPYLANMGATLDSTEVYKYTFDNLTFASSVDYTTTPDDSSCCSNVVSEYFEGRNRRLLNNIVIDGSIAHNNIFRASCNNNTFGPYGYDSVVFDNDLHHVVLNRSIAFDESNGHYYIKNIRVYTGLSNLIITVDTFDNDFLIEYKNAKNKTIVLDKTSTGTRFLYFDDFGQDADQLAKGEFARNEGFDSWSACVADILSDSELKGANKYGYTGETIEYNGNTYYLWIKYNGDYPIDPEENEQVAYIITDTIDYDTLYSNSLEADSDNEYCPYVAILNGDLESYRDASTSADLLIKVEQ